MSSFKRRGASAAGPSSVAALPAGVRPSSFSSPVPLLSTGVPALDDILSGGGLSSGSLFTILPTTGTAALSAERIGSSAITAAEQAQSDHISRAAAEPYTELILAYAVAQAIASRHRLITIGEDVGTFTQSLMARAGDSEQEQLERDRAVADSPGAAAALERAQQQQAGPSERLGTVPDDDDDGAEPGKESGQPNGPADKSREREMRIAWRYEKLQAFKTTVEQSDKRQQDAEAFCSTFDLSRRISPQILQRAAEDDLLHTVEIDSDEFDGHGDRGANSYDLAFARIRQQADHCIRARQASTSSPGPVLRVSIRSLGSPCWRVNRGQRVETESVRFLARLKALLRSLAIPTTSNAIGASSSSSTSSSSGSGAVTAPTAIPAIAIITISPYLLSAIQPSSSYTAQHLALPANLIHRLSHVSDACISLSAFAPSPALRAAFPSYTGALKVLKTPALGTLVNPSVRASILRGMGAGAATSRGVGADGTSSSLLGSGTVGEGGAGGGENNLAFKVRRKRLVIETLHLDVEGGVSERRTKPPKNVDEGGPGSRAKPSATGRQEQVAAKSGGTSSFLKRGTTQQPDVPIGAPTPAPLHAASSSTANTATTTSRTHSAAAATTTTPKFGGLKSLRERGLAAANRSRSPAESPSSANRLEVELDTRQRSPHQHAAPQHPPSSAPLQQRRAPTGPVFKSDRKEDYEF